MNRCASVAALSAVAAIVLGGWLAPGAGRPASAADEPALKIGEERAPADEAQVIKDLVALQLAIMKKTDPTKRGQHPKHHGCVDAEFAVHADIQKEYRFGIFKEAKSYKAKVRFSNATRADDRVPDAHGMAVKVLGVKGPRAVEGDGKEEQHFVLIDGEEFFAPDPKTVLAFLRAGDDPKLLPQFLKDNPATALALKNVVKVPPASPVTVPYFSTVPFKLGNGAVKYAARPADGNGPGTINRTSKDYLRAVLVERLGKDKPAVVFEFSVVPQTDPAKTPIENPTVHWDAKPVVVATLKIAPQEFDTPARLAECETAVFDPWAALADHRPLGGINRARKEVYAESVKLRHSGKP